MTGGHRLLLLAPLALAACHGAPRLPAALCRAAPPQRLAPAWPTAAQRGAPKLAAGRRLAVLREGFAR
jgi:hypothetical protein